MYEQASNTTILMLLNTAVYPFIAALIFSVITGKWFPTSSFLGYLGGFVIGLSLVHTGLSFPPNQAIDYYSTTALIGIAVSLLMRLKPSVVKQSLIALLFGVSFYLLLNPVLKHSGQLVSLSGAAVGAVMTFLYFILTTMSQNKPVEHTNRTRFFFTHLPTIGLMIAAGASSPVVSIGGSLLLGQLLGVLAAALMGYLVASYALKTTQTEHHIVVAFLLLAGVLTQSHVLADIPTTVMLMMLASGFVTPIAKILIRPSSRESNTQYNFLIITTQGVMSLLLSGLSVWLVWPQSSLY
ncbi:hypothetical protein FXV75_04090 [Marinomonas sp. IMCC 4694]|nr:hypothetical protein FXV75_04090 [Marinomonas sp. IMCC 4694]